MKKTTFTSLLIIILLTACNMPGAQGAATPTLALQDPTPSGPTPTPEPELAATVNGEDILLASYQASLTQFEAALQDHPDLLTGEDTAQSKVLLNLIDRQILSAAARQNGFVLTEDIAAQRLNRIIENIGGNEAFASWITSNGYIDLTHFQNELKLEIEAAWQRDQIAAAVPATAEQIEARQVLFYSEYLAQRAYDQLQNGAGIDTIVANNDPNNLGYLGWFPRGYLLDQQVEDTAFALQPTQHSTIIETPAGYIILYIIDRQPDRPLAPDARQALQSQAIADWVALQRAQSQIEIHLP